MEMSRMSLTSSQKPLPEQDAEKILRPAADHLRTTGHPPSAGAVSGLQRIDASLYARFGKRLIDIVASSAGLIVLSPVLILVGILTKCTSRGPMLYWQDRVGLRGTCFRIAKFRSMVVDAEKRGPDITSSGDPRVTPVGSVIRNLKLDELPQLWNVLKGEMSLVGPRPELPKYVASYSTNQTSVLAVRPGITDPASL